MEAPAGQEALQGPNRSQAPVGGRLALFAERWRSLFPDSDAASILQNGVLVEFSEQKPPLSSRPVAFPTSASKQAQLQEVVQGLLEKQAIEPVQNPLSPGFYSRLFTVPKSSGGLRPVIDLSVLNRFIWCPHFQMETAVSIKRAIKPGEWVTSVDLSDAYLHVPLSPTIRKYFRFVDRRSSSRSSPLGSVPPPGNSPSYCSPSYSTSGAWAFVSMHTWTIGRSGPVHASRDTRARAPQ